MALRSVLSRVSASVSRSMELSRGATRYFSDGKGRVLGEEERAAENVYIKVFYFSITISVPVWFAKKMVENLGKWDFRYFGSWEKVNEIDHEKDRGEL